jgi:hypothetical protein
MMTTSPNLNFLRASCITLFALISIPATAQQFGLFDGEVVGIWKNSLTIASGYRARDVNDPQMVGAGAGLGANPEFPGANGAVGVNDDPQLNFRSAGDRYSAPMTWVSELSLIHKSGQGVFVRGRAWYDLFLEGENVPHGNVGNLFTPNSRISDEGFTGAAEFSGADFYDYYYFANFDMGGSNMKLRVGRQAIDWGEGIFYPGINSFNPYDYAWLNMPGAPVLNGGKLPVNRVYLNWAGKRGYTVDGFFNLEYRPSSFPGCGVYYQAVDNGINPGCNSPTAAGFPDTFFIGTRNYYNGSLFAGGYFPDGETDPILGNRPMTGEPSDHSGWGVSAHKFVESLATDFGVYYTTFTSPTFVNAAVGGATPANFSINTMFPEDVKAFAISASTGFRNLAAHAQLTWFQDFPTHYNAPEYIIGTNSGAGPFGWMRAECVNASTPNGSECKTYWDMDITQLQFGGTWQFGQLVGLPDVTLAAEVDMQWNTNLPPINGPRAYRLGRFGNFGVADWDQDGYVCNPGPLPNGVVNRCEIDGYTTDFAWGYKIRLATNFPRGPALTFVPSLTWGQDIEGFSADQATHVEGRWSLSLFLRTLIYQKYYVDLGAVRYNSHAEWDPLQDKGQYTIGFGANF